MRENGKSGVGKGRSRSMANSGSFAFRKGGFGRAFRFACLLLATASPWGRPLLATSVIPISDAELYRRADVIVHGIVLSSDVTVDDRGRPETLIFIEPLAVLKGQVSGSLVLHQAGGTLPDGRFFKLWGRPEYVPGRKVVVFAIARAKGEYETAEMLLGKFEVWQDAAGNRFAVPDLTIGHHPGVEVREARQETRALDGDAPDTPGVAGGPAVQKSQDNRLPRRLTPFLAALDAGSFEKNVDGAPAGKFEPVHHEQDGVGRLIPQGGRSATRSTAGPTTPPPCGPSPGRRISPAAESGKPPAPWRPGPTTRTARSITLLVAAHRTSFIWTR